ncbi:MAG: hypothetical protein BRC29_00210 [Nanohaloarchaea archaeon SW_7_43_1]|nr:MAG: hypothetical protein BRC29_00210 [Nanohaloarchaea archaeon SW_7_43_1]
MTTDTRERATEMADELGFSDEGELMDVAVDTLLAARPDIRKDLAIALYRDNRISLDRAVEIAGMERKEFKEILKEENIERESGSLDQSVKNIADYSG